MKRFLIALSCVLAIIVGLQLHRSGVAWAGLGGFWLTMLPRPRARAVYAAKRPAISSPKVQEKRT